jgi:hypothetical protein
MVAAGRADIAMMPTSEIVYAAGVDFAGNIAPEIQFVQTFSAAIVAGSGEIEAAKTADRPSRLRTGFGSHPEKRNGANRVVTRLAALGKIWPRFFKTLGRSARRRLEMLQSPALCRNRH